MRRFLLFLLVASTACGGKSNESHVSAGTYRTVAVTQPPPPTLGEAEAVLALLDKTNKILEKCIMPTLGLNAKRQTCEAPPSTCYVECNCCD